MRDSFKVYKVNSYSQEARSLSALCALLTHTKSFWFSGISSLETSSCLEYRDYFFAKD